MTPSRPIPDDLLPSVGVELTAELRVRLERDLGPSAVSTDPARLERLSVDWAHMSPILTERLPAGRADLIATPTGAEEIPVILRHAYELRIPVTPRGTGLGNYGQAIPLHGGLLLDVSACRAVLETGDGWVRAEAGVRMRDLDAAVHASGQELTIYPSTKGSTLGGFLAGGSGGTGSITYGSNADGFVHALDVAPCDGTGRMVTVSGDGTVPFVHAYGTTGIISRATVAIAPAHDWVGLYTAWDEYTAATAVMRELCAMDLTPRLISFDEAAVAALLPADPAIDPHRISVRAIIRAESTDDARRIVGALGGEVLAARTGANGADRLTSLSYNHSTFHLQKKLPDYFHLEVGGDLLQTDPDRVRSVYPDTLFHLEQFTGRVGGMLMARYESPEQVYAGMTELEAMGISIHSPHTWILERRLDRVQAVLDEMDPLHLLNPGKLPATVEA
ncbi:MAG TPA: FAD-binding oxidoreductase [Mycobacteriales bacterium]|nr:FAD-binding oxidoreductase [Mycobacteriales bacterium]